MNGVLILGSIGEFFALTTDEKKALIRLAVDVTAGRGEVLVGTGGTVVREVIELTNIASDAGADAAVIISPYYFQLDQESLYRFYAAVAAEAQLPVVLYNFPDRTATSLEPELVLRLAEEFPNIIGIKDTLDSISHTRALITTVKPRRPDFRIVSGFDEYLLANLAAGGDGLIGGLSNLVPSWFAELYTAFGANDLARVRELQAKVSILMGIYAISQPFVGAIKGAASLVVEDLCPACRTPAGQLTEDQFAAIRRLLDQAGVEYHR